MSLIVAKFGGTSVANLRRIERCIPIIKKLRQNHQVVVVVSAMAGETNRLQSYLNAFKKSSSFHDLVLSSGESITVGLFCLMLEKHGFKAQSFLGWQVPIITSSQPTDAVIYDIPSQKIHAALNDDIVPVIAGFQGVSENGCITTIGRGGSDTTAVYLAHALKAYECQIYSDVEGVFTSDPNVISSAKCLETLTYHEMFQLSHVGAKVLQLYAAQKALEHQINVRLLSSFIECQGTLLTKDIEPQARFASLYIQDNIGFLVGKNIAQLTSLASIAPIAPIKFNQNVIKIDLQKHSPKELHDRLIQLS